MKLRLNKRLKFINSNYDKYRKYPIYISYNKYVKYYSAILSLDISNGSNSKKVLASINEMTQHYGSTCVIIEKDRNKGTTSMEKTM